MFTCTFDEAHATLVCRYTSPHDATDYDRYHAEFANLIAAARSHRRRAILIIDIEDGYPQPNAVQRKAIGEAWAKVPDVNAVIAIISDSTLIRGIITAIEWYLKNSTSRRETRAYARVADTVEWLHDETGVEASQLTDQIEKTRASSSTRRSGEATLP